MTHLSFKYLLTAVMFTISAAYSYAQSLPTPQTFKLQKGDLLFQDLNCGQMCDSIDSVTFGYHNSYVSHVAMVISAESNPQVIEADSKGVVITPLTSFLQRSLDENGKPRVMVGRLTQQYQALIPAAIKIAKAQLGKPYNPTFIPANGKAFYCSELIDYSFKQANNQPIFHELPMNFTGGSDKNILLLWQNYYNALHSKVPQGVLGTNPGRMSRESGITIVYFYGHLRQH